MPGDAKFTPSEGVRPLKEWLARPDNGLCMSDFQVKRIILPSGKAVEIVYLQSAPGEPASHDETLVAAASSCARVRRRARASARLA